MSTEALLGPLSSLEDTDDSLRAARQLLDRPAAEREIEQLYPALVRQYVLPSALHHLERAGGDLERLSIPLALFRATGPLNGVLAPPDECAAGRISLAGLRRRLAAHEARLRGMLRDLVDAGTAERWLLLFGRAIEATYPAYGRLPRLSHDIDLFLADLPAGFRTVAQLCDDFGFVSHGCRVSLRKGGWLAHVQLARAGAEDTVGIDLLIGGRVGGRWRPSWHLRQLEARARWVEWEGRRIRVPSAEDLLLMLAEKTRRKAWFTLRDFSDAHFLLAAGEGRLDWDYVGPAARRQGLRGALHVLATEAERRAGRPLVPGYVRRRLAPGMIEGRLIPSGATAGRPGDTPSKWWERFWFFQQIGARLGRPRPLARLFLDHFAIGQSLDSALASLAPAGRSDPAAGRSGDAPLRALVLENMNVSDAGLARLRDMRRLRALNLGGTAITGAGLVHLRGLTRLRKLSLANTDIADAALNHLGGLTKLQVLDLSQTAITGLGLAYLKPLSQLRHLSLRRTHLSEEGLACLRELTHLQTLHLDDSDITDAGLAFLGGLGDLVCLYLRGTRITDAGLMHLRGLKWLQVLDLGHTGVTDAGLMHLRPLTELRALEMDGAPVSETAIEDIWGGCLPGFR